jgi:hypothetical protein
MARSLPRSHSPVSQHSSGIFITGFAEQLHFCVAPSPGTNFGEDPEDLFSIGFITTIYCKV